MDFFAEKKRRSSIDDIFTQEEQFYKF